MKKRKSTAPFSNRKDAQEDKPATLKDLLSPEVVSKLKAKSDGMKAEEVKRKEDIRKAAEDARKTELKRLENDFEHLLNNSSIDWKKFKS
jgi:hypothetical protein